MRRILRVLALGIAAAAPASVSAQAGGLAARVAAADGSTVAFEFPARSGVCGDGHGLIRVGPGSFMGRWNGEPLDTAACKPGPVRVRLTRADGALVSVRASVGPVVDDGATDLGAVPAAEAAEFLLGVAERGSERVADEAIPPALLGDGVNAGPRLVAIARARPASRPRGRHEPLFWAGRYAAAKLQGASTPFESREGCEASEDKRNAVFVLSQLHDGQAVPGLIDVVRTNKDGCVRASALFWLVESGDDRAVDVVASILGTG